MYMVNEKKLGKHAKLIGYIGTFIFSIRLIPEIYHVYSTKEVKGLDMKFILLDLFGSICFLIYAFYLKALPMIIANSAAALGDISLLYLLITISNKNK